MLRKVALAALALTFAFAARAADLGGNSGLADLEERVAELEATTARKGNRKVTVTVYGAVNKAIVYQSWDDSPYVAKRRFTDGAQSPTHFGFMGDAKVNPDLKAGFTLEFGVDENANERLGTDQITVRKSAVWLEGKVGRLTLGRTSQATDGIVEITTANTDVAAKMLSLQPISSAYLGGVDLPFDGGRRDIVRYDSPTMAGFILSASWGTGDPAPILFGGGPGWYENRDVMDIALRWAGEFSGFRVAAGVGYRSENRAVFLPGFGNRLSVLGGSASVKHLASGLFVNGAYAKSDGETLVFAPGFPRTDLSGMHVQGGWEHNVFGIGSTTLMAEWAQLQAENQSEHPNLIGLSAIQALDSAAMDIYASWRQFDGDTGDPKINTYMLGARIRF